jgi:multiple sugar transport system substrate-binding protein
MKDPEGTSIRGYAFPGKSDWNIPHNFAPWIWSSGGDFLIKRADGHWASNLMDPNTITGIGKYLRFILDSAVEVTSLRENTAQITQRFNNGELAFILNTAEVVMQTRYQGNMGGLAKARIGSDGVLVFPVPSGNAGSISFIGGSNLAIPKNMEHNGNAQKLLLF